MLNLAWLPPVLMLMLDAPAAGPPELLFKPGQTVAFDGDSLTSRAGPDRHGWSYARINNWDTTWADVVEDWFFCNRPQLRLRFRNTAIGGSTITDLLARYDRTLKTIKPNWVLFTTGSNDVRRLSREVYERNLETYLKKLKTDFGARAVIVDMFHPELWPADEGLTPQRADFMAAATKILARYDGVYVRVGEALFANSQAIKQQWVGHTVMADGGHLNAVGAQMVATQVLQALGAITIH